MLSNVLFENKKISVNPQTMMRMKGPSDSVTGASSSVQSFPTSSISHPSEFASMSLDIVKTQGMTTQIRDVGYNILLSFGVIVSYFFFLESLKLVNYGN